jgi:hypothetical protein
MPLSAKDGVCVARRERSQRRGGYEGLDGGGFIGGDGGTCGTLLLCRNVEREAATATAAAERKEQRGPMEAVRSGRHDLECIFHVIWRQPHSSLAVAAGAMWCTNQHSSDVPIAPLAPLAPRPKLLCSPEWHLLGLRRRIVPFFCMSECRSSDATQRSSQANNPGFSAPSTHPFGAFNQQVAQPAPYTGLNISQPIGFTSSLAPKYANLASLTTTHPPIRPVCRLQTEYPRSQSQIPQNSTTFPPFSRTFSMTSSQSAQLAGPPSRHAPSISPHTHVCRNLVQSGSNIAKDLNAREFGQEIVNNAATGRQIFHVRAVHLLPISDEFILGLLCSRTYRLPRTRSCPIIFSPRTSAIKSTKPSRT